MVKKPKAASLKSEKAALTLAKPKKPTPKKKAEGSQASKAAPSSKQQETQVAEKADRKKLQKNSEGKGNTKSSKRKIKGKTPASKAASKAGSHCGSKAGSKTGSKAGKYKVAKWSICRVCNRAPKDLPEGEKWGATDAKGEPIGDGCLLDMATAVSGWPSSSWVESSSRFHSEPVFKAAFKAARAEKKRVMLTESKWNPPSAVVSTICRAREVYSKIGFLSESEVAKLTGSTAKALKLTAGSVQLEDRPGEMLKGYYISLLGMPSKLRGAVRKIKLVWRISNQVDAYNLQPENQITQDQGLKLFHHMCDTAMETMDGGLKTVNRSKLISYDDMMDKAKNLEKERQVEEQADDDGDECDEGEGEEESPQEDDQVVDVDNDGGRAAPTIKHAFGPEMCPQPVKKRRKSGKTPDTATETDVQETDESHPDWLQEDVALKSVVTKLGRFYRCFRNMNPEQNIMHRKPAGHQIKGARTVLDTMEKNGYKEASTLKNRIVLVEHLDNLLHGPAYSSVPRAELLADLLAISSADLSLPTDLRLQLLERLANDLLADALEIQDSTSDAFIKALQAYMQRLHIWMPDRASEENSEMDLSASMLMRGAKEEIAFKKQFGKLSQAKATEEMDEFYKDFSGVLMEALCSDQFYTLVKSVGTKKNHLLKLCEAFLNGYTNEVREKLEADYPEVIVNCYKRVHTMFLAMVVLLHPEPNYLGSSPTDINNLRKYQGADMLECTLRDCLTSQNVILQKGEETETQPNPWVRMYDELLSKGEFTQQQFPRLQELEKVLNAMNTDSPLAIDVELLCQACKELSEMKSSMREGLCTNALKRLEVVLVSWVTALLKTGPAEIEVGSNAMKHVQGGLALFTGSAGVSKLADNLAKWRKGSQKTLLACELLQICRGFPGDLQSDMNPNNIGSFVDAWQACWNCSNDIIKELPADKQKDVNHGIAWVFRCIAGVVKATEVEAPADARVIAAGMKLGTIVSNSTHPLRDWIGCQLETMQAGQDWRQTWALGDGDGQARLDQDPDGVRLAQVLKASVRLRKALRGNADAQVTLSPEDLEEHNPLLYFDIQDKYQPVLQQPVLMDMVSLKAVKHIESLEEMSQKILEVTREFGTRTENAWKYTLAPDSPMDAVLAKYKETLETLDGDAASKAVEALGKERAAAQKFMDQACVYTDALRDLEAKIGTYDKVFEETKCLVCESLLCLALNTSNKVREMALVRSQLGDIAGKQVNEALLLPQLVKAARDLVQ